MPSSPDATFLSILESNQNEDELFYQTMISWVNVSLNNNDIVSLPVC